MDALALTLWTLEDSGNQWFRALDGLTGEGWNASAGGSMTPAEMLVHLTDCCHAFLAAKDGKEYDWGSYQPTDTDPAALLATFKATREHCIEALKAWNDEKGFQAAMGYLALHESYHVGQLCLVRLALDPYWPPYSIYGT
jgi:uncharacterized damage-inducible protein DinB